MKKTFYAIRPSAGGYVVLYATRPILTPRPGMFDSKKPYYAAVNKRGENLLSAYAMCPYGWRKYIGRVPKLKEVMKVVVEVQK